MGFWGVFEFFIVVVGGFFVYFFKIVMAKSVNLEVPCFSNLDHIKHYGLDFTCLHSVSITSFFKITSNLGNLSICRGLCICL